MNIDEIKLKLSSLGTDLISCARGDIYGSISKQIGYKRIYQEPKADGRERQIVFQVFDILISTYQTYSSWGTSEWSDEYEIVEATPVTVIEYLPKKD